ncbi:hypothetical protein GCM10020295_27160 [Streptomyces cinereospinus]
MAASNEHPGEQGAQEPIKLIGIRDTPLSLDEVFRAVGDAAAGGTALFVGTVRNHDGGADVDELGYSCHPSAEAEMRRVAEKVVAEYPVRALAAVHRVGGPEGRGPRRRGRCVVPAPRRGLRSLPEADRRPQARGADLEAPEVLRRHRGVGGRLLTRRPGDSGCVTAPLR